MAIVFAVGVAEARQAPVLSAPTIVGANITLTWTATAGATGYRLDAGIAPGAYLGSAPLGADTTLSVNAPAVANYFLRVVAQTAGGDVASNEVVAAVTSLVAPPPVPVTVQGYSFCNSLGLTWAPGPGAATTGYIVRASRTPGTTEVNIPTTSTQLFSPSPGGTIYFRVAAVSGGAVSADSPEVAVTTTAGVGTAPPVSFSNKSFGILANVAWSAPGATAFTFNAFQDGNFVGSGAFPAAAAGVARYLPAANWQLDVTPVFPCGSGPALTSMFSTPDPNTSKMQPRAADPAQGSVLPTPGYAQAVVFDMANRFPGELRNSCTDTGGNMNWIFRVVAELRTRDKRWGLNWKRTNFGDVSKDIITYNWSSDPDEGSYNIRVYDIIGGHCGPNPGATFNEVTVLGSTGARWTLLPYIQAGFQP